MSKREYTESIQCSHLCSSALYCFDRQSWQKSNATIVNYVTWKCSMFAFCFLCYQNCRQNDTTIQAIIYLSSPLGM